MSVWVEAARPRTLPAAVAPVLVGTAAADRLIVWRAVTAAIVALALQVAVNYANDVFDHESGVDTGARVGPRRVVAAGLVTPRAMRGAVAAALGVAAVGGVLLAWAAGWWLLLVGLAAGAATLGYSGGRRPYASRGLGEVTVFVFFGVVATVGSQYVQDETWSSLALLVSLPVGAIATALLVVNNLRDIPTDARSGKRTLAVRLGDPATRRLFGGLLVAAGLVDLAVAAVTASPWPLLTVLAVPLAVRAAGAVLGGARGRALITALEQTGRCHLVHGVALAVGLALAT